MDRSQLTVPDKVRVAILSGIARVLALESTIRVALVGEGHILLLIKH